MAESFSDDAQASAPPGLARAPGAVGGVRAGGVVLVGIVCLNAGNYLFHLLCARTLGPVRYGDLATLLALSSLVTLPLGGVQVWVARHVARFAALGDLEAVRWFARRSISYATAVGIVATAIGIIAAWRLQSALAIASIAAVALTALTILPSVMAPISWGLAQGLQRFTLIATVYASGAVARLALAAGAFAAGLYVGGAMLATLAALLLSLAIPMWALRAWFAPAQSGWRRITRAEAAASLVPAVAGILAITSLTSVDMIVAKASLGEHAAGIYGSASLFGRAILYLPAAVITVLLPRVTARAAGRQETVDLLRRSVAVTLSFCLAVTAIYALLGGSIVRIAFGGEYANAAGLLWLFGIAMTGYAILNVALIYDLGRSSTRLAWLLAAGALAQLALFTVFHGSARTIVGVDIAVSVGLLAIEEMLTHGRLLRALAPARR
jgi:O-antigen/teichoic acid export membrane protein